MDIANLIFNNLEVIGLVITNIIALFVDPSKLKRVKK